MTAPIKVAVPGRAYRAALDPLTTQVPRERGWPTPELKRRGRGEQAIYLVTPAQGRAMAEHLESLAETFTTGVSYADDPAGHREGHACRLAAERLRIALGYWTAGLPDFDREAPQ